MTKLYPNSSVETSLDLLMPWIFEVPTPHEAARTGSKTGFALAELADLAPEFSMILGVQKWVYGMLIYPLKDIKHFIQLRKMIL